MNNKIVAAMSGGVDSSVAALLLQQQGFDLMGVTMKFFYNEEIGISREKTCCSLSDVEDARAVAAHLGIPFYVMDFSETFRQEVMERFVQAYEQGRTPNPCIVCNRYLKFSALTKRAAQLGFDAVATGHYARICSENGRYLLKKARDESKDQTYMLYSLTQEQLQHARFPLGDFTKEQVRDLAEENGLINARKRDSQDICFVQNGSYADFIEQYTGKTFAPGEFVDESGKVLGVHKGIIRYTIGQRKGLGLALNEPMYVKALDLDQNRVILSRNEALFTDTLRIRNLNLIPFDTLPGTVRCQAKVRYAQKAQSASASQTGPDEITLHFDAPQRAVTPGQAAVLYDSDLVIGGGEIC